MMNRRTFLGTMSAAAVLSRNLAWAKQHKIDDLGLTLYTVSELLAKDVDDTLARVAEIGYRKVEGPMLKMSARDTKAALDRHGLHSPSAHRDYVLIANGWEQAMDDCNYIGHKYVSIPWIPDSARNQPDAYKHIAETFNRAAEISKKAGIQFAFHNHWIEFTPQPDGKLGYDILLEECDRDLVKMEMDMFWSTIGGIDPVPYFARYPGRFPLVHIKDTKKIPNPTVVQGSKLTSKDVLPDVTEPGNGVIDWKRIFAHADQGGIKHFYVEYDKPKEPIQSARVSYEYLEKLRF